MNEPLHRASEITKPIWMRIPDDVSTRTRCDATHPRLYRFDAISMAPIAQFAIDIILDLHLVEREAHEKQLVGRERLMRRRQESPAIRARLHEWLTTQKTHCTRRRVRSPWRSTTAIALAARLPTNLPRFAEGRRALSRKGAHGRRSKR